MIVFRYKSEKGAHQQLVKRPVADVWLKKGSGWGELLGFKTENEKIEEIGGIRGAVPVIYKNWKIKIGEKILPILIAWALIEEVPPLLGRADVFDFYKVTFNQRRGEIIFEENK